MRLLLESCINITAGLFGADTLHIPPQVTKQDMPHVVFERRTWAESVGDILKSALWHTRCLLGTVTVPEQAQAHSSYRQRRRQDRARVVLRYDVLTERQRRNKSSLYYQKHPYSTSPRWAGSLFHVMPLCNRSSCCCLLPGVLCADPEDQYPALLITALQDVRTMH